SPTDRHSTLRVASDPKRVGPGGVALDIGREAFPLVGEITHAMIPGRSAVVGDVEHAPALAGEIQARRVRRVGIEEHGIASAGGGAPPRIVAQPRRAAKPAWRGQKFSIRWSTRSPGRSKLGSKYFMQRPGTSG